MPHPISPLLAGLGLFIAVGACVSGPPIPPTVAKDFAAVSWGMSELDLTTALGPPEKRSETISGLPELCFGVADGGEAARRCYGFVDDRLMWRAVFYKTEASAVRQRFAELMAVLDMGDPKVQVAFDATSADCNTSQRESNGKLVMTAPAGAKIARSDAAINALAAAGKLCLVAGFAEGPHPLGGVFARPRKNQYVVVAADSTRTVALHERRMAMKLAAARGESAALPPACAKVKTCLKDLGDKTPAAREAFDSAWRGLAASLKGPQRSATIARCRQALEGYSRMPDAPSSCRP